MVRGLATVVIPIYNVEKYLDRCINSVINQTYQNLEIILVDDGSPDRCPQMCEEWSRKDSRIKVIHKENAGLGMARNTGIENANGEYLFFVDSDDYIALETVEKVLHIAERTNAELIMYGPKIVDGNGNVKKTLTPYSEKEYYEGEEICNTLLADMITPIHGVSKIGNIFMSFCNSAFKFSLIERSGFRLVSEREFISEDIYSFLCLMRDVQSAAVIPEAFYYYCENGNSLSRSYHRDRYDRLKAFYTACMKKCVELGYSQEIQNRFPHLHMNNVISALKQIIKSNLSDDEKKKSVKEIVEDDQLQQIVHGMNLRYEKPMRRLLLSAIRRRQTNIVYWLVKVKIRLG